MRDYLNNFPFKKISIFITIVVSFTYNVLLDRNMECTCNRVSADCCSHFLLPAFIFFLLILWTDKKFLSSCKYTAKCACSCCKSRLTGAILIQILRAVLVGSLWMVSVLIDGDWFVCCKMNLPKNQTQLACKDKTSITFEEQLIITGLKNQSRNFGFLMLLAIVFLGAMMSALDWRRCFEGKCDWFNRRVVYDQLVLKESEDVLREVLGEAAKNKLKTHLEQKIKGERWTDCFNVVQEMIEKPAEYELPKKEEKPKVAVVVNIYRKPNLPEGEEENRAKGEKRRQEEMENRDPDVRVEMLEGKREQLLTNWF